MATQLYKQGGGSRETNNDYSMQNKGRIQTERKHRKENKETSSEFFITENNIIKTYI